MPLLGGTTAATYRQAPYVAPAPFLGGTQIVSPPPTVTTVTLPYTETWTGTDGSAWPALWTLTGVTGTSTATIQANTGQVTAQGGAYAAARPYLSGVEAVADQEVVVDFTPVSAGVEQYIDVSVRGDGSINTGAARAGLGYAAFLSISPTAASSQLLVDRLNGGTATNLSTTSVTITGGVTYRLRFRAVGADISVKVWPAAGSEPGSWTWTGTDATPYLTAGRVSMQTANGADAVARSVQFDNLSVDVAVPSTAATATGSVALGGTVTAAVTAATVGTITLGGTTTAQARATAAGAVTLGGTSTATVSASSAGSLSLGGTSTAASTASASGVLVLGGTVTAGVRAAGAGTVSLGGTASASASPTAGGTVVLGGSVTARVPATAAGLITLSGLANGAAAVAADVYHPHVYVTASLAGNGTGTAVVTPSAAAAVLTPPSGFGEAFGEAFGGWQTSVTATLDATPAGTAVLDGNGASPATLASNGVSTATLSEVPAMAELQLT